MKYYYQTSHGYRLYVHEGFLLNRKAFAKKYGDIVGLQDRDNYYVVTAKDIQVETWPPTEIMLALFTFAIMYIVGSPAVGRNLGGIAATALTAGSWSLVVTMFALSATMMLEAIFGFSKCRALPNENAPEEAITINQFGEAFTSLIANTAAPIIGPIAEELARRSGLIVGALVQIGVYTNGRVQQFDVYEGSSSEFNMSTVRNMSGVPLRPQKDGHANPGDKIIIRVRNAPDFSPRHSRLAISARRTNSDGTTVSRSPRFVLTNVDIPEWVSAPEHNGTDSMFTYTVPDDVHLEFAPNDSLQSIEGFIANNGRPFTASAHPPQERPIGTAPPNPMFLGMLPDILVGIADTLRDAGDDWAQALGQAATDNILQNIQARIQAAQAPPSTPSTTPLPPAEAPEEPVRRIRFIEREESENNI